MDSPNLGTEPGLPLLLIVSGSPASGKSSLAEDLAEQLGLPLISRDDIKEAIMDVIPVADLDASHLVGAAAFVAMYRVLDRLLAASTGVVLESTFERGRSEGDLKQYFDRSRPLQVNCQASAAVLKDRLAERIATGSRHPGHQDAAAYQEVEAATERGDYRPLDLDVPLLQVDSNNGFDPDIPEVLSWIEWESSH
jgi:predicted kinase